MIGSCSCALIPRVEMRSTEMKADVNVISTEPSGCVTKMLQSNWGGRTSSRDKERLSRNCMRYHEGNMRDAPRDFGS